MGTLMIPKAKGPRRKGKDPAAASVVVCGDFNADDDLEGATAVRESWLATMGQIDLHGMLWLSAGVCRKGKDREQ